MDLDGWQNHPVKQKKVGTSRSLAVSSGVKVSILCCDLFMKHLFSDDRSKVTCHFKMSAIISSCKITELLIEIPVIADARIKDETDSASLSKGVDCLDYADHHDPVGVETVFLPFSFVSCLMG